MARHPVEPLLCPDAPQETGAARGTDACPRARRRRVWCDLGMRRRAQDAAVHANTMWRGAKDCAKSGVIRN
eukprot:6188797-Pleurochrysis_carterae.AAC.2